MGLSFSCLKSLMISKNPSKAKTLPLALSDRQFKDTPSPLESQLYNHTNTYIVQRNLEEKTTFFSSLSPPSNTKMVTLSLSSPYTIKCSSNKDNEPKGHKPSKSSIIVNGFSSTNKGEGGISLSANVTTSPAANYVTTAAPEILDVAGVRSRQNIPTQKQISDPFRMGIITEGGFGYRQTIVIRSYEVGPDKTATLETILNLLQETALNHVWQSGLLGDGFGATHGMIKNDLIWVVTRLHVQVDKYPIWGEVVEIDTWVGSFGKNGMRRDWLIRSHLTGHVYARGTSTWVMMHRHTRRLSKMPDEVRDEISPWFIERQAIAEDGAEKIIKLDDNAVYFNSDLKPKRNDLDMNHHVNNVKYVKWMLETIPDSFLERYQLSSIILEYRRECGSSDIVQSLCEPDEDSTDEDDNDINLLNGFILASEIIEGRGLSGFLDKWPTRYTHLLKIKGQEKNEEIVRGRTTWRKKSNSALNEVH